MSEIKIKCYVVSSRPKGSLEIGQPIAIFETSEDAKEAMNKIEKATRGDFEFMFTMLPTVDHFIRGHKV